MTYNFHPKLIYLQKSAKTKDGSRHDITKSVLEDTNSPEIISNLCLTWCGDKMDNYDKIIFVIKNRGWKNGKLMEFIKTSKNELNKQLVDKNCLDKLMQKLNEQGRKGVQKWHGYLGSLTLMDEERTLTTLIICIAFFIAGLILSPLVSIKICYLLGKSVGYCSGWIMASKLFCSKKGKPT